MSAVATITEHALVAFDGARLRWFEAGAGQPLLVSLPIGLHADFLKPLVAAAGDRFRFVWLQSRGLWGSDASINPADDSIDAHARDIAALVEVAGLRAYAGLGYCGGSAPLLLALDRLDARPRSLLLLSTLFRRGSFEEVITKLIARLGTVDRPATYRGILSIAFRYGAPALQDLAIAEICTAEKLSMFLRQLLSLYRCHFPEHLTFRDGLTLALAEHDSDAIRESTQDYAQAVSAPGLRLVDIAGAGHFFAYEEPARMADLLDTWLAPSLETVR